MGANYVVQAPMPLKKKNQTKILRYAAELGHYIADAHVPLHASSNHNGQFTDQKKFMVLGSRIQNCLPIPNGIFIGKAEHINNPGTFIWNRVLESAAAADSVLKMEKELSLQFPSDQKYAFEDRNGITTTSILKCLFKKFDEVLSGMVEEECDNPFLQWHRFGTPPG